MKMKKVMNQSTRSFILNGFSILALFITALLLLFYSSMNGRLHTANQERFDLTYNANRFMNGSSYLTNEVRAYAATGDITHYNNYWNEVNNLKNRDQGVAAMQAIGITQDEQALIDAMSSLSQDLVPLEENAMENVKAGKMQEAVAYVYGQDYDASITQINALKTQFLETLDARTSAEVQSLLRLCNVIRVAIFLALVLVCILLVVNIRSTRRRILHPLMIIRDQMGEIASGNLSAEFPLEADTSEIGMLVNAIHETKQELKTYIHDIDSKLSQMADGKMNLEIDLDYRGEFLPIQKAMRQILDSLNGALAQIHMTAGQVSTSSERMASGAQILSQGAMEQSASIEALASSIQELSHQVTSTSEDAETAQACSTQAASALIVCDQKLRTLISAMQDISSAASQIGGIIKTIEDISFQTNILALNASVEAARAGEAGKGFAVVANEVQSLANKSAEAAQNTSNLIENSLRMIKQGTALTTDTASSMDEVMVGAKRATELIGQIAESAVQQAQSLNQLTSGMDQISNVIQTNSTTAEESAQSAQELYGQAAGLKRAVQQFQLRNQSTVGARW